MRTERINSREDPYLIQNIKRITGYKKSEMVHEGLLLLNKSLDPTGIYEKEKALRDAWENRIKHTENLTSLLSAANIDYEDFRYNCIENGMSLEELLKIQNITKSPEKTEKIRSET